MACKITRTTCLREISEEEFVRMKASEPFAELRQTAKQLNFLMIFGGSPRVFVGTALETRWSPEQAEAFIRDNGLLDQYEMLRDRYKRESPAMVKYLTVATYMKQGFFELYKGLARRIEANKQFAREHGYVRSYFGAKRNLIEELLRGAYDDRERGAMMRNLDNVCANTDIQNFEACVVNQAMVKLDEWLEETGMKSKIWNMVHDSCDLYVHKSELAEVVEACHRFFEQELPELKGVPLAIDIDVSDLNQGHYYKGGQGVSSFLQETA